MPTVPIPTSYGFARGFATSGGRALRCLVLVAVSAIASSCSAPSQPATSAEASTYAQDKKVLEELEKDDRKPAGTRWDGRRGSLIELVVNNFPEKKLEDLGGLENLKTLTLDYRRLKEVDVSTLNNLAKLDDVRVIGYEITDDDIKRLSEVTKLRHLELYAPKITDTGLSHLKNLKNMTELVLFDTTRCTEAGEQDLQKSIPGLTIMKWLPNRKAEEWVTTKVQEDEPADLKDESFTNENPRDTDRVLSAAYLKKLLASAEDKAAIRLRRIVISNAIVVGKLDLTATDILPELQLNNCDFRQEVDASRCHFAKSLSVEESSFVKVNFSQARVDRSLSAQKARFSSLEKASFNGINVGENANFQKAEFAGEVDFIGAVVGGQFQAVNAQFHHFEEITSFNHLAAKGGAFFQETVFEGPVDFITASVAGFEARKAHFNGLPDDTSADFDSMQVAGYTDFDEATFGRPVSFENANVGVLNLTNVKWPSQENSGDKNPVYLGNLTYGSIRADDAASAKPLLDVTNRSAFDKTVYMNLESFFSRHGRKKDADAVYVTMRTRERHELSGPAFKLVPAWIWNVFLEYFIHYGRQPLLALGWILSVVLVNWLLVFPRNKMEPTKPEEASRPYYGFWYTLDTLLPVVKFGVADSWMPRQDRWIVRRYVFVLKIVGWILVPIAVAAAAGLIH